jgi:hypothetical protein
VNNAGLEKKDEFMNQNQDQVKAEKNLDVPRNESKATPELSGSCGCTATPLPPKSLRQMTIDVRIDFCPLHAAAPALYEALSCALDDFRSLSKETSAKEARMRAQRAYQGVRAVLALAKPSTQATATEYQVEGKK